MPFSIHKPSLPFNNPFPVYEDASPALLANTDPSVLTPLTLPLTYFLLFFLRSEVPGKFAREELVAFVSSVQDISVAPSTELRTQEVLNTC